MKLNHLTDKDLLRETSYWANKERESTAQLLWRLKEVDSRKLYSDLKCSSLFDYCVKVLKYSESQASRRVTGCRLLKQLPELAKNIEKGELNLTQLNQVNQFFKDEQIMTSDIKEEIIDKIKNKTTRETDRILADLRTDDSPRSVTIVIREDTLQQLRKIQDLKGHACPDLDTLLIKMSVIVARVWDPTVVHRKRSVGQGDSRYLAKQVKAQVWDRDKGKCTNCGSTRMLQFDHISPLPSEEKQWWKT